MNWKIAFFYCADARTCIKIRLHIFTLRSITINKFSVATILAFFFGNRYSGPALTNMAFLAMDGWAAAASLHTKGWKGLVRHSVWMCEVAVSSECSVAVAVFQRGRAECSVVVTGWWSFRGSVTLSLSFCEFTESSNPSSQMYGFCAVSARHRRAQGGNPSGRPEKRAVFPQKNFSEFHQLLPPQKVKFQASSVCRPPHMEHQNALTLNLCTQQFAQVSQLRVPSQNSTTRSTQRMRWCHDRGNYLREKWSLLFVLTSLTHFLNNHLPTVLVFFALYRVHKELAYYCFNRFWHCWKVYQCNKINLSSI